MKMMQKPTFKFPRDLQLCDANKIVQIFRSRWQYSTEYVERFFFVSLNE